MIKEAGVLRHGQQLSLGMTIVVSICQSVGQPLRLRHATAAFKRKRLGHHRHGPAPISLANDA
jgi:hypothetical protein